MWPLLFAEDQEVIAQEKDNLDFLIGKLINEYRKYWLGTNYYKTEYLVVGRNVEIEGKNIRQINVFKYLAFILDYNGSFEKEG